MSVNVCSKQEKAAIAELIGGFRFSSAFGTTLSRLVRHGIGVHHAGMLPKYRRLVEQLAQAGLLKVICGTDTLGVAFNVPIRTVVFSALSKYDGTRTRLLNAREFHQIAGRPGGRATTPQAPSSSRRPTTRWRTSSSSRRSLMIRRKASKTCAPQGTEGMVPWSESTMTRLVDASPSH